MRTQPIYFFLALSLLFTTAIQAQFTTVSYHTAYDNSSWPQVAIDQTLAVGNIPAQAGVSETGAATYNIPIVLPPGTQSLVPGLSISYSSQSGNGILGYGWHLSGLSSITRGNLQYFADGEVGRPEGKKEDTYYLDGQRIIHTGGPIGGQNVTTIYHTQAKGPFDVKVHDWEQSGPYCFQVNHNGGLTYEYGCNVANTGSAWFHEDGTKYAWAINKIKDCNDNYVEFEYYTQGTQGDNVTQQLIKEIRYTGHASTTPSENKAPYNKIVFDYVERDDRIPYYVNGGNPLFEQKYLLNSITIYAEDGGNSVLYKTYSFEYALIEGRSTLVHVRECGANGGCINPIRFKMGEISNVYNELSTDIPSSVSSSWSTNYGVSYVGGNFNNDGFDDIVEISHRTSEYSSSNSAIYVVNVQERNPDAPGDFNSLYGTTIYSSSNSNGIQLTEAKYKEELVMGDFDGNGLSDILLTEAIKIESQQFEEISKVHLIRTDPQATNGFVMQSYPSGNNSFDEIPDFLVDNNVPLTNIGDFNGDGLSDFFVLSYNVSIPQVEVFFYLSELDGNGSFQMEEHVLAQPATGTNSIFWEQVRDLRVIDYDGDGNHELLLVYEFTSGPFAYVMDLTITGSGSSTSVEYSALSSFTNFDHTDKLYPGDFNGDRITDILSYSPSMLQWNLLFGTGAGFDVQPNPAIFLQPVLVNYDYKVADFNGDGLSDISLIQNNSNSNPTASHVYVLRSLGGELELTSNYGLVTTNSSAFNGSVGVGDFNGDGRQELFCPHAIVGANANIIELFANGKENLLVEAKGSFNQRNIFDYASISFGATTALSSFYNLGSAQSFPFNKIHGGLVMVAGHQFEGNEALIINSYDYVGAIIDRQGGGFLGFDKIIQTSSTNNHWRSTSEYGFNANTRSRHLNYVMIEDPLGNDYTQDGQAYAVSSTTYYDDIGRIEYDYTYSIHNASLGFYERVLSETRDIDYLSNTLSKTNYQYLNDFTLSQSSTQIGLPYAGAGSNPTPQKTVVVNVEGYTTTCNGRTSGIPVYMETTTTRNGETPVVEGVKNNFDQGTYKLLSTTQYADLYGLTGKEITTEYSNHDIWGNPQTVTLSTNGLPDRITSYVYDDNGRWPVNSVNPLGQTAPSNTELDNKWGKPHKVYDLTGQLKTYSYDEFGRLNQSIDPLGNTTTVSYEWDVQGGAGTSQFSNDNSIFKVTSASTGTPISTKYYDRGGRVRMGTTQGFNGQTIKTMSTYDQWGRLKYVTTPSTLPSSTGMTTYTYDGLGRNTETNIGGIGSTTYTYEYLAQKVKTIVDPPSGEQFFHVVDATGVVLKSEDNGGTILFEYNSRDQTTSTSINSDVVSTSVYDPITGRQNTLWDVSSETTTYDYNNFGELIEQKTGNGTYTEIMAYDIAGRLTSKDAGQGPTYYLYVTSGNGLNQLQQITTNLGEIKTISYDNYNRPSQVNYTTQGVEESYTYDNLGRLNTRTVNGKMEKKYTYNNHGYLSAIDAKASSEGGYTNIWTGTAQNDFGQYTNYSLSNGSAVVDTYNGHGMLTQSTCSGIFDYGYAWNMPTGNLVSRDNNLLNLTESFYYDNLQRLTDMEFNQTITQLNTYSSEGAIESGVNVNEYSYNHIYRHDMIQNGSQIISTNAQEIGFNDFNEPEALSENGYLQTFNYGPDDNRIASTLMYSSTGGAPTTPVESKTYFPGFSYETFTNESTQMKYHLFYEAIDGRMVSIIVKEEDLTLSGGNGSYTSSNGDGYHSIYTDHLGSILKVTDDNGAVLADRSFDAWGRERNPITWLYTTSSSSTPEWLIRGYTAHEMLDEFALVHMNGRMYAPLTGKMLSPDNYVQAPYSTQGYNRYAYAFNNPLKYSDPNGEWVHLAIGGIVGGVVGGVVLIIIIIILEILIQVNLKPLSYIKVRYFPVKIRRYILKRFLNNIINLIEP